MESSIDWKNVDSDMPIVAFSLALLCLKFLSPTMFDFAESLKSLSDRPWMSETESPSLVTLVFFARGYQTSQKRLAFVVPDSLAQSRFRNYLKERETGWPASLCFMLCSQDFDWLSSYFLLQILLRGWSRQPTGSIHVLRGSEVAPCIWLLAK